MGIVCSYICLCNFILHHHKMFYKARIWVSSIGFTLLFGPILVKAFRVYYIFRNIHKTKKSVRNRLKRQQQQMIMSPVLQFQPLMKDYILLLLVAAMVVVDVVFLAVVSLDDWRLRFSSTLRQRSVQKECYLLLTIELWFCGKLC